MAVFNCQGPGNTHEEGRTSAFVLADLSRCFRRPECREFFIASRADRGCAFFMEPTWTEFYLGLHFNALAIVDTKIRSLIGFQKRFLLGEALAFRLRLNIRGTSLSHIYLRTFLCICVS